MLPETTRDKVLEAFAEFDGEARANDGSWSRRGKHKYAIRHEGRIYPVKEIISMVTGRTKKSFQGGATANNYITKLGFEVVELSQLKPAE